MLRTNLGTKAVAKAPSTIVTPRITKARFSRGCSVRMHGQREPFCRQTIRSLLNCLRWLLPLPIVNLRSDTCRKSCMVTTRSFSVDALPMRLVLPSCFGL